MTRRRRARSAPSGRTTATRSSARSSSSSTSSPSGSRATPTCTSTTTRTTSRPRSSGSRASTARARSEVDELLRREVFVDLYRVVAQRLRISHPSYWLKEVETFYMPERDGGRQRGRRLDPRLRAVARHGRRRAARRDRALQRGRLPLDAAAARLAARAARRGRDRDVEGAARRRARSPRRRRRRSPRASALRAGAARRRRRTGDERWLLAQLLEYHRREARPVWWAFFARLEASAAELRDGPEAIGGLEPTRRAAGAGDDVARLHARASRPAAQARRRGGVVDPATEKGEDDRRRSTTSAGTLRLTRGPTSATTSRCRGR